MELVAASPTIQIVFQVSLPQCLFSTALLLRAAGRLEGLDDWVLQAAARLSVSLTRQLSRFALVMGYSSGLWGELLTGWEPASETDYDGLHTHLARLPDEVFRLTARRALDRRLVEWGLAPAGCALKAEEEALSALLTQVWQERQARDSGAVTETQADVRALVPLFSGGRLKEFLLSTLSALWEGVYVERYRQDLVQIRRAVAYHQTQRYPAEFRAAFAAITGRAVPPALDRQLDGVRRVAMAPVCHIGPYLVFARQGDSLSVSFNAATAPSQPVAGEKLAALYTPLKGLADETRLQILGLLVDGERYVGEIAELLNLSHSSASRHLSLLTAAGFLTMRKENNLRYYRLDPARIRTLIADLEALLRP